MVKCQPSRGKTNDTEIVEDRTISHRGLRALADLSMLPRHGVRAAFDKADRMKLDRGLWSHVNSAGRHSSSTTRAKPQLKCFLDNLAARFNRVVKWILPAQVD
jgi:hypothetical protein